MISYWYKITINELCLDENVELFAELNISLIDKSSIDSNTRNWSILTKFQIGLSLFNIFLSLLAFIIFLKISRSQYANQIHIYLLVLSAVEVCNQYLTAYDFTNRYLSVNQHDLSFSSLTAAKVFAIANHVHNVMIHSMFSTLNWWITVISLCRCRIMCHLYSAPKPNRINIRGSRKIKRPLCILVFILLSSIVLNQMIFVISETNKIQICLHKNGSASLSSLLNMSNLTADQLKSISLFTVINSGLQYWLPLMTLFISTIYTWASILERSRWHRGRYRKASLVIGLLMTSYLILETPIFIASLFRFFMDYNSQKSDNTTEIEKNYIVTHYVSLSAEIINNCGSLINIIIFLVADPTFRKITIKLIRNRMSPICGNGNEGAASNFVLDSTKL